LAAAGMAAAAIPAAAPRKARRSSTALRAVWAAGCALGANAAAELYNDLDKREYKRLKRRGFH